MMHEGLIEPTRYAIFADTQEEPQAVYDHLAWLRTVHTPVPIILTGTAGKLGDDLSRGENSTVQRCASIPAFTAESHTTRQGKLHEGMIRRQCTKEYKVEVVERVIRYEILKLTPRQHIPKGVMIEEVFGISYDERSRCINIERRFQDVPWAFPSFPLVERKMTRQDCKDFLRSRVPHETPRSACVFCPFKSAQEWLNTKQNPTEWARAIEIDAALREPGRIINRGLEQSLYLHRQCIPLQMVDLEVEAAKERENDSLPLFELADCGEGMCGL